VSENPTPPIEKLQYGWYNADTVQGRIDFIECMFSAAEITTALGDLRKAIRQMPDVLIDYNAVKHIAPINTIPYDFLTLRISVTSRCFGRGKDDTPANQKNCNKNNALHHDNSPFLNL